MIKIYFYFNKFTKTIHSQSALESIKEHIGPDTIVLTLQNGLGNDEMVERFVAREKIVVGTTNFPSDLIEPGYVSSFGEGVTKIMAFLLVFTMLFLTACGGKNAGDGGKGQTDASGATVLKFGHMSPETSPSQQYALKFKDLIEERTDGKYKIEIYPAGVLGKDRELAEGL